MKQEDIEQVEDLLYASEGRLGYAYLYPNGGGAEKEFVFEMTPGNIAAFIGAHQMDAQKIILTDFIDLLILDTKLMMPMAGGKMSSDNVGVRYALRGGKDEVKER